MTFVGVDPGASGGIALFAGGVYTLFRMPDTETDLSTLLRACAGPCRAFYERLPMGHPDANPSSMAKLHRNAGVAVGLALAFGWTLSEVPPQEWQGHFKLGTRAAWGNRWKAHIKDVAQKLHPDVPGITLKTADALLILDYGLHLSR